MPHIKPLLAILAGGISLFAGCTAPESAMTSNSYARVEGSEPVDGRASRIFVVRNRLGMRLQVAEYGATITRLEVPDRNGESIDVVLGFDTIAEYPEKSQYFGCTVGRVGNRIAGGTFELDGTTHQLARNNGENHLHGGTAGFDKSMWAGEPVMTARGPGVVLTLTSPDGDEGYPGELQAVTTYVLTENGSLEVEMTAVCDAPCPVNLVHHTYWNLGGHDSGPVLDETLVIEADRYTPVDAGFIPTGELEPVEGTGLDFRTPRTIGRDIEAFPATDSDPGGYDHNFCLDGVPGTMRPVARLSDPDTGIVMTIETDQPGLQFYTGNFLDGMIGKGGATYDRFDGLCLETQAYPDSINRQGEPGWPDVVLRPGDIYRHRMVHRFTTE